MLSFTLLTCDILCNFSVTSDVQDVEVCINSNAFLINCIYITVSTSNCNYILVHINEGIANITGQIPITNNKQFQVEVNNTMEYIKIIAYDTPSESSLSSPIIPIIKSLRTLNHCQIAGSENSYSLESKFRNKYCFSVFLASYGQDFFLHYVITLYLGKATSTT